MYNTQKFIRRRQNNLSDIHYPKPFGISIIDNIILDKLKTEDVFNLMLVCKALYIMSPLMKYFGKICNVLLIFYTCFGLQHV